MKHITSYLPYGLKVSYQNDKLEVIGIYLDDRNIYVKSIDEGNYYINADFAKPILRPLSDLFKPIDWDNNNEPYMIGYKYGIEKVKEEGIEFYISEYYAEYAESPKSYIDITSFNWWLFEHHFDVFGLIPQGLAIDINTLK